jgi:hypothetical protein
MFPRWLDKDLRIRKRMRPETIMKYESGAKVDFNLNIFQPQGSKCP